MPDRDGLWGPQCSHPWVPAGRPGRIIQRELICRPAAHGSGGGDPTLLPGHPEVSPGLSLSNWEAQEPSKTLAQGARVSQGFGSDPATSIWSAVPWEGGGQTQL